ncbi:hypothetical protein JG688_00011665 [Phytophthora aleatoria]|uniref:Uncharacterized protein n=1 Tax=Phytophthora aleatoria TaxID=2496075 RepID=A0A8J5J3R8_9STRA|nr:hypothetical protein JG688_00011665 [Phytophthora aleatoria]
MRGDSPGETVTLLIYEYGVAITETQDILAFRQACIRPEQTDRANATAENYLREVVARLRAERGGVRSKQKPLYGECGAITPRETSINLQQHYPTGSSQRMWL